MAKRFSMRSVNHSLTAMLPYALARLVRWLGGPTTAVMMLAKVPIAYLRRTADPDARRRLWPRISRVATADRSRQAASGATPVAGGLRGHAERGLRSFSPTNRPRRCHGSCCRAVQADRLGVEVEIPVNRRRASVGVSKSISAVLPRSSAQWRESERVGGQDGAAVEDYIDRSDDASVGGQRDRDLLTGGELDISGHGNQCPSGSVFGGDVKIGTTDTTCFAIVREARVFLAELRHTEML